MARLTDEQVRTLPTWASRCYSFNEEYVPESLDAYDGVDDLLDDLLEVDRIMVEICSYYGEWWAARESIQGEIADEARRRGGDDFSARVAYKRLGAKQAGEIYGPVCCDAAISPARIEQLQSDLELFDSRFGPGGSEWK